MTGTPYWYHTLLEDHSLLNSRSTSTVWKLSFHVDFPFRSSSLQCVAGMFRRLESGGVYQSRAAWRDGRLVQGGAAPQACEHWFLGCTGTPLRSLKMTPSMLRSQPSYNANLCLKAFSRDKRLFPFSAQALTCTANHNQIFGLH